MKNKRFTAILIIIYIILTATNIKAGNNYKKYNVNVSVNSEGDIEYNSNYSESDDCNMYTAIYNSDKNLLEKVEISTSSEGIITVDAGKIYDVVFYFWKDNMVPVSDTIKIKNLSADKKYVVSKKHPEKYNSKLSLSDNKIITSSRQEIEIIKDINLTDKNADDCVKKIYKYLAAIGKSDSILFGQQNNISHKAGSEKLSDSDVYDITSDYSAICGIDTLSLAGAEYNWYRCNMQYGTAFKNLAKDNVMAAAYLSNMAIENGAIITLSAHMPNFSLVEKRETDENQTYAKYNFNVYTSNILEDNVPNEILEGEKYNEVFNAYLDMIADYSKSVNGVILFRPFHENTGNWFWWGTQSCTPELYKEIYSYTVKYLRDIKGVHNILYVYSPSNALILNGLVENYKEFDSAEDYSIYYPGDEYVDIVGFDIYDVNPDGTDKWLSNLKIKLDILNKFAMEHNKLCALTETGVSKLEPEEGDIQTALLKSGNKNKDWFIKLTDIVSSSSSSYFMVWSNFGETNGFYTPYAKKVNSDGSLYGHEMIDNFIEFYNSKKSIFASDQKDILKQLDY